MATHSVTPVLHGIKDNHNRGRVADFLSSKISTGSHLSVVSAYFTIYAYEALQKELEAVGGLRFLFGEPRFIQSLDPEKTDKKAFKIEDEGLELANRLQQKEVAIRCAEWIQKKVEIRSIRETNLLHGKPWRRPCVVGVKSKMFPFRLSETPRNSRRSFYLTN